MLPRLLRAIFVSIIVIPLVCLADDSLKKSPLSLSGFGTLGLTTADSEVLGFRRNRGLADAIFDGDISFRTDSLLGFQARYISSETVHGTVQLIIKEQLGTELADYVNRAFLSYQPTPATEYRLGRIGVGFYLASEYRYVAFANPWVRPSSEFYGSLIFPNYDGIDISHKLLTDDGIIEITGFYGVVENLSTPLEGMDDLVADVNPLYGANLEYQSGPWRVLGALARATVKLDQDALEALTSPLATILEIDWPGADDLRRELTVDNTDVSFTSLGVVYDNNQWILQAEIMQLDSNKQGFSSNQSAYVCIGYQAGSWTPYLSLSTIRSYKPLYTDNSPEAASPFFSPLYIPARDALRALRIDQTTASIGARVDLLDNLALKMVWNVRKVDKAGSAYWIVADPPLSEDQTVNTLSINLDFIF